MRSRCAVRGICQNAIQARSATGASGWNSRAERSMAMAAYAMTPRDDPAHQRKVIAEHFNERKKAAIVPTIPPSVSPTATAGFKAGRSAGSRGLATGINTPSLAIMIG